MSEFFYLLVPLCFRRQLNLLRTIPALNCILIAEDLSSILVTWFQRHTMKINQKDFVSDLRELPLMNRFGELRKQHFQVPSKGSEGKGGLTWAENNTLHSPHLRPRPQGFAGFLTCLCPLAAVGVLVAVTALHGAPPPKPSQYLLPRD